MVQEAGEEREREREREKEQEQRGETGGLSYGVPYSQYSWFNQEPTRFQQERKGKFSYCEMVTIAQDTCKYRSCPEKVTDRKLPGG